MYWYHFIFLLFLLVGALIFIKVNDKKIREKDLAFLCMIVLLFFAVCRDIKVGADTKNYIQAFLEVQEISLGQLWYFAEHTQQEFGYVIYSKVLTLLFHNPQCITVANSLLLFVFLWNIIKEQSKNPWLSMFIYLTFGFYQTALNLMPSSIAGLMSIYGFRYIKSKEPMKFVLLVLLASQIHLSALMFLPFYFLYKIRINKRRATMLLVICLVIYKAYDVVLFVVAFIIPERYKLYLSVDKVTEPYILIFHAIVVIVFLVFLPRNVSLNSNNKLSVLMLAVAILSELLALKLNMFGRLMHLFAAYFIVAVPQSIENINNRIHRIMVTTFYVCLFTAAYIGRLAINNIGSTMPYDFFW